jgi:hypothetical protein
MEPCAARHTLCGQQHGWERLSHSMLLGKTRENAGLAHLRMVK